MSETEYATSADGTRIAFERSGSGPVLVLVDGAFCFREFGPSRDVAKELRDRFTVVIYDRRGRGESENTLPYAPEREFEDLRAVIAAVGGEASVLGQSSGAALSYRAAAHGVPTTRLIGYEAPWVGLRTGKDGTRKQYHADLDRLIDAGANDKAISYFMVDMIGAPRFVPLMMRFMSRKAWRTLLGVAPTLRYDAAIMGSEFTPPAELADVSVPTLVLCGSKAAPEMLAAQEKVAASIPGAEHAVLDGQTHQVSPAALRPQILRFLLEKTD
ncbi:pimeloyl-ACP methyl ester carboxylesterase [Microbacteriaceae bacterium SG_E_30_P1]|uniref:Pimeloyl-ACP methyl ester carboxylesterase n=1 Tax=Antiquaquibacter oligotrophicus TaxID=2880260 RepID=A0ABT6KNC1_9MICO|nr:alpha/beta hydrolase [Antiquaquibacter oligotrophicus]MDH6181505.1 pimeloyl-ACP methyl ester carboxylesterase [Antiquaquibacter oligotrophicus]UDF12805.1 alpha/beta hydrolase [Antiquaquibacter oligotrophicus]